MTWVLIVLGGWLVVAVLASLVIGRTVHKADVIEHKTEEAGEPPAEGRDDDAPPAAGLVGFLPPLRRRAFADR